MWRNGLIKCGTEMVHIHADTHTHTHVDTNAHSATIRAHNNESMILVTESEDVA